MNGGQQRANADQQNHRTTIGRTAAQAVARHPFLVIAVIGLLASLPMLLSGYPPQTHDGLYHPVWARHFSEQLWSGELYPRWLVGVNGGLGDPTFFLYPPVPFYIAALFDPVTPGDTYALWQLGLACTAVLIASGWAALLWLRKIAPSDGTALLGALFYMLAPYHLAVDLYTRGAFAEFCAFLWLPLILYWVHGIAENRRGAIAGLACSCAGLIATHPLTALIFAPVSALYPFLIGPKEKRIRVSALTFGGGVLGVGLSGIYWLTAIPHRNFVHIEVQSRKALLYSSNYLFTSSPFSDTYQSRLGWIAIATTVLAGLAWWAGHRYGRNEERNKNRISLLLFATAIISLLMTTPLSSPVWEILIPLQTIQFPYRFLTLLTLAAAGLLAMAPLFPPKGGPRAGTAIRSGILGTAALSIPMLLVAFYSLFPHDSELYRNNYERNLSRLQGGIGAIEYVPRSIRVLGTSDDRKLIPLAVKVMNYPRLEVTRGDGTAQLVENKGRTMKVRTESRGGAVVIVYRFYYEGWKATSDSGEVRVDGTENLGFTRLIVPPGKRTVELRMEELPEETWGKILSGLSFGIIIALLAGAIIKSRWGRRETRRVDTIHT